MSSITPRCLISSVSDIQAVSCAITLVFLAGCSDGGPEKQIDTVSEAPPGPAELQSESVSAHVSLERRGTKLVADAWVRGAAQAEPPRRIAPLWTEGSERCSLAAPEDTSSASGPATTLDAGDLFSLQSRAGTWWSLERQAMGTLVTYATQERWTTRALPDDAMLQLPDALAARGLDNVALRPQMALAWQSPTGGRLQDPAAALRWEGSADPDDRIVVQLAGWSAVDRADERLQTIVCELLDDGEFAAPQELQALFRQSSGGWLLSVARQRETTVLAPSGDRLAVLQTSLP